MAGWSLSASCVDRPDLPWDTDLDPRHRGFSARRVAGTRLAVLIREAKAVCHACPVQVQCLAAAVREEVRDGDVRGIRGGLTAPERLRRKAV